MSKYQIITNIAANYTSVIDKIHQRPIIFLNMRRSRLFIRLGWVRIIISLYKLLRIVPIRLQSMIQPEILPIWRREDLDS